MIMDYIKPSFSLFGLQITWYAICILVGVVLAVVMAIREGKKIGIASDDIYWGVIIVLPCAIIGARLWYILFNLDQSWTFREIIGLEGGLSGLAIQGGIIAALIAIYVYCRVKKLSIYRILDVVAPGFLIGQICGRWGNFCNHELYGPKVVNTGVFEALLPKFITENMRIPENGPYYHPTFLYEALLNLGGLVLMFVLRRKFKKLKSGDFIGIYMMWYGGVRIFTESLRMMGDPNDPLMLGPIPVSILVSVIFIVCGLAFLIVKRFFGPKEAYKDIVDEIASKKMDTILFDLDGTLLNSKPLIDRSFVHTFEHFRPDHVLTDDELDSFFGPTLHQTFSKYSKDEAEINDMISYYREFNVANHDSIVKLMPGVKEMILTLHKRGYNLGVVSSKKTDLVCHGLELFGLLDKMDVVIGSDEVKNHKPAPDGIELAIKMIKEKNQKSEEEFIESIKDKNKIQKFFLCLFRKKKKELNRVAYVGDTINDIKAGKSANVITIGCLYVKHPEEIIESNPDYVIQKPLNIIKICLE